MAPQTRWHTDKVFWIALGVGLCVRAAPMLLWGWSGDDCTRDECIYKIVSRPILEGRGLAPAPKNWLPAPGFPYVMAACHQLLGSFEAVKWVHWLLTLPLMAVQYAMAGRVGGLGAARWMAVLFALHPTFVFFTGTMWTETFYTLLLVSTVLAVLWCRDGLPRRAAVAGALLGCCVLFRGVATYLAPICLVAMAAPEGPWTVAGWRAQLRRFRHHLVAFVAGLGVVVLPYSVSASQRWGGTVISDATVGHVLALGNDDFPPVTFDYAIGPLTGRLYGMTLADGRGDCPRRLGPIEHDRCEVERALDWIADHPVEFVARVPTRLAQLFNPNSFLTRHIRWNFWPGIPWLLKEFLVALQVFSTVSIVLGGTIVAWARGRGSYVVLMAGIISYHMAVISLMYGMTRFRLPLEPLWMVFLACGLAAPRDTWTRLRTSPRRMLGAVLSIMFFLPLLWGYAWTGFPGLAW